MQNGNGVIWLKNKTEKRQTLLCHPSVSPLAPGEARPFESSLSSSHPDTNGPGDHAGRRTPSLTASGGSSSCGHQGRSATAVAWCPGAPHHIPSSPPQSAVRHPRARRPKIDKINICLGNDAPGPLRETWRRVSVVAPLPLRPGYQKQTDGVGQESQVAAEW